AAQGGVELVQDDGGDGREEQDLEHFRVRRRAFEPLGWCLYRRETLFRQAPGVAPEQPAW
ncbi:hypothetical protein, partial [Bradyrhizobium canariense]|uniref:hypothetical protein n=1 Tax=Bradyrhizobium canariense TaxID=255045 RepID=UPI001AED0408